MSYITISAKKLRELCQKKLESIRVSREKAILKHNEERLQAINSSWWRRLFKVPLTLEQVAALEEREAYDIRTFRFGYQEAAIKNLLKMAESAGFAPVRVCAKDFFYIS